MCNSHAGQLRKWRFNVLSLSCTRSELSLLNKSYAALITFATHCNSDYRVQLKIFLRGRRMMKRCSWVLPWVILLPFAFDRVRGIPQNTNQSANRKLLRSRRPLRHVAAATPRALIGAARGPSTDIPQRARGHRERASRLNETILGAAGGEFARGLRPVYFVGRPSS
jgi:hypothetical protein